MKAFKTFMAEGSKPVEHPRYEKNLDGKILHPQHNRWHETVGKAAKDYVKYRGQKNFSKTRKLTHHDVMDDILYNSYQSVPKRHWDSFSKAIMKHPIVAASKYKL